MGDERRPDPGDDPRVQRNRIRLGLIGAPLAVVLAAGLWAAGLRAVATVVGLLGVAVAGAAVDAAARRGPIAGTRAHARILWALAVLSLLVGLVPFTIAGELLENRRGTAALVLVPMAALAAAWSLVRRARGIRRV